MKWIAHKYLWQVRRATPFREVRKSILAGLREPVMDYSQKFPKANLQAYWMHFGSPRQLAENAFDNTDAEKLYQEINHSKHFWRLWLIVAIFAIAGFILTFRTMIHENRTATNGYFGEELIEKEYDK